MIDTPQPEPPKGHFWVEDLARAAKKDVNTLIWLCEQELIQAVLLGERWAVRVVRTTTTQGGTAVVRDLKAGRDIAIGSVIGQYVTLDGKDRVKDAKERIKQTPIRGRIDNARAWLKVVWLLIGVGVAFFVLGLMFTLPFAAIVSIPAFYHANQALVEAKSHGDKALLEEVNSIYIQALILMVLLVGFMVVVLFVALLSS